MALTAVAQAGDVYRYVDTEGNVVYTDYPPTTDELVDIESKSTDPGTIDVRKKRVEEYQALQARKTELAANDAGRKAQEQLDRADNCRKFQEKLVYYEQAHRMYEETEGGGRRYYTAEEQTAAIDETRANVKKYCD
ncbi:MAG: DUF4124 domain-containing protein [Gammaproteobacteria bacterium]